MERKLIVGAIAGDIIGSVYERNNVKTVEFEFFFEKSRFTDDSILTLAIMIGGDSDTIACITGGIAETYYKSVFTKIIENVFKILPPKLVSIVEEFSIKYNR